MKNPPDNDKNSQNQGVKMIRNSRAEIPLTLVFVRRYPRAKNSTIGIFCLVEVQVCGYGTIGD